jgi:hypothetical protein
VAAVATDVVVAQPERTRAMLFFPVMAEMLVEDRRRERERDELIRGFSARPRRAVRRRRRAADT